MADSITNALLGAEPLLGLRDNDAVLVVRGTELFRMDPAKLKTQGRIVDWDVGGRMTPQIPRLTANPFSLQNAPRVKQGVYVNATVDNGLNVAQFDVSKIEDGFGWATFNGVLPQGGRYWLIYNAYASGGTSLPDSFKLQFGSDPATLINNPAAALASVDFFTGGPMQTTVRTYRAGTDTTATYTGQCNVLLIDLERSIRPYGPGQLDGSAVCGSLSGARLHVTATHSRRNVIRRFSWQAQRKDEALLPIPEGYSPLRMMNSALPENLKDGDTLRVTSPGVFNDAILKGGDLLIYRDQGPGKAPLLILMESSDQTTPASRHAVDQSYSQLDSDNAIVTHGRSLFIGPITSKYRNPLLRDLKDSNNAIVMGSVLPLLSDLSNSFVVDHSLLKATTVQDSTLIASNSHADLLFVKNSVGMGARQAYGVRSLDTSVILGSEVLNSANAARTVDSSVVIGHRALLTGRDPEINPALQETVAIGHMAMFQSDGASQMTAVGTLAAEGTTKADGSVAVGHSAFYEGKGVDNVAVGHNALRSYVIRGEGLREQNTAVGAHALKLFRKDLVNATAIGYNAQVSGSHQVQLGDSRVHVYTYQAIQQRCDRRDKADTTPSTLGLDFILSLKPVQHRYDFREDYIDYSTRPEAPPALRPEPLFRRTDTDSPTYQAALLAYNNDHQLWRQELTDNAQANLAYRAAFDVWETANSLTNIKKDGSKKRNRLHQSFLADDVKAAADKAGVDFGGYQDHLIDGGEDVKTLAMQEFIPPLANAIQEMHALYKPKLALLDFAGQDAFVDRVAERVLALMDARRGK